MPTATSEREAASGPWTIDHWLRHCDGYGVWEAGRLIGYVEGVLLTEDREPHSLVVRAGSVFSQLVTIPVEAIESVDPGGERIVAADRPSGQLRLLAVARP